MSLLLVGLCQSGRFSLFMCNPDISLGRGIHHKSYQKVNPLSGFDDNAWWL